jgi:hypothetical protein
MWYGGMMLKRLFSIISFLALLVVGCNSGTSGTLLTPTQALVATETQVAIQLPTSTPTATERPVLEITVNTVDDVVDSTSTSVDSLLSNPGPDGFISLREALLVANLSSGLKRISFDPSLHGQTIILDPDRQYTDPRLVITGEEITIDGDIDSDGSPDITLDGSSMEKNFSTAFLVSSGEITIDHFILRGFQQYAFIVACIDPTCSTKPFQHIRIRDNEVYSDNGGGVTVTPLNIFGPLQDAAFFSDFEISDIEISGNLFEITGGHSGAIFMQAAGGGLSRNRLSDIVIRENTIRSPGVTISILAADANSLYYGFPGPVAFSDDNLVENITISDNILDPTGLGGDGVRPTGIFLLAGNSGNSGNIIRGVVITGNEISSNAESGIVIYATMIDSSSYLPVPAGTSTENIVKDVLVENNTIHAWMRSILFTAAEGEYYIPTADQPAEPGETGRLSNIRILSNSLVDFQFEAVDIFVGSGASDNSMEAVIIEQNIITSKDPAKGVAIYVFAGGCSNCSRVSQRNQFKALVIQNNIVTCDNFLWLSAGLEEFASNNLVEYFLGENTVTPADAVISIADSAWRELQGNLAVRLESLP